MLKCGGAAYLRRPLSFCDVCERDGAATFLYRISGAGTKELSLRKAGEPLDIIGPLGNGFDIIRGRRAIVGGGIGLFPLLLLAKRLCGDGAAPDIYAGFRDAGAVVLENELKKYAADFTVVSDDGSTGVKALATEAFARALAGGARYDAVYACGPAPMLRALACICENEGIEARFSLEQRMGCGIGACLVCACAVKSDDGPDGESYARVCADGPVFSPRVLSFDNSGGRHG